MNLEGRLQSAKAWVPTYEGKSLVGGYAKRYGTDRSQALRELQMIGVTFTEAEIETIARSEAARIAQIQERKRLRLEKEKAEMVPDISHLGPEMMEQETYLLKTSEGVMEFSDPILLWQILNDK
jgi:hypothetical protein